MTVFERLGRVVKAELSHLVRRSAVEADPAEQGARPSVAVAVRRAPAVVDVEGALRVLELSGARGRPTLAQVRAQYRALARRYHPKTQSPVADEARSARVVVDALTDALELLEAHLLPV